MQRSPTCPLCHHVFGVKDPSKQPGPSTPLLLLCGHTFCERCLSKTAKNQVTQIACPTCKEVTKLKYEESTVKSLWPDIYKLGILSLNRRQGLNTDYLKLTGGVHFHQQKKEKLSQSVSQEPCTECSNRIATCICIKCDAKMCSLCFDKIHQSKTLKKHVALPLLEWVGDISGPNLCETHQEPIEYYCEEDGQQICSKCIIFGEHRGHPVTTLDEKDKKALEDMEPLIDAAHKVLSVAKKSNKVINSSLADVQQGITDVIEEIHTHFSSLHALLQAREIALLEEVSKLKEVKSSQPEEIKSKLLEESKKIEYALSGVDKLKANSVTGQISAQALLSKLEAAKTLQCCAVPSNGDADSQEPDFKFSTDPGLLQSIKNYGKLEINPNERLRMCSLEDMPEDYLDDEFPTPASTPCQTPDTASIASASDAFETESVVSGGGGSEASSAIVTGRKSLKRIRPPISRKELVYVTHIRNPNHFTVQQVADIDRLKSLAKSIGKYCNGPRSEETMLSTIEIGDLVLGQFEIDKHFYRAKVTGIHKDQTGTKIIGADLYYIDYGNEEVVPLARMRAMQDRFLKLPELAVTCSLLDIIPATESGNWDPKAVECFARMTNDRPMLMTTRGFVNNVHQVDLSKPPMDDIEDDRPVSVRDALVFMEYAIFTSPLTELKAVEANSIMRKYYPPQMPMKGEKVDCVISNAISPSSFSVQLMREARHLEDLMRELQAYYGKKKSDLYSIYVPQKGMVCVAQYSEDQAWYRALVSNLPGRQQVEIVYVDFGNTEIVPYFKLKKILDKFMIMPIQAIDCELADVKPIVQKSGWSDQANQLFANFCSGKTIDLEVRRISEEGRKLSVALRDMTSGSETCLNALMVQYGYASSTGPTSMRASDRVLPEAKPLIIGSAISSPQMSPSRQKLPAVQQMSPSRNNNPSPKTVAPNRATPPNIQQATAVANPGKPPLVEVIVSHIEHPGHIYLQVASAGEDGLDKMMFSLNKALRNSAPPVKTASFAKDDFCVAKYSRDKKWYRAKIENIHNDNYQVHMLDFGFKDLVPLASLRPMDPNFLSVEMYAMRCHLVGIQPAGDINKWSQTSIEYLSSRVANKILFIAPNIKEEEDSLAIDLLLEEKIIGDALTPDQKNYISLAEELKEKGLALPKRKSLKASPKKTMSRESVGERSSPVPSASSSSGSARQTPILELTSKASEKNEHVNSVAGITSIKSDSARASPAFSEKSASGIKNDTPYQASNLFKSENIENTMMERRNSMDDIEVRPKNGVEALPSVTKIKIDSSKYDISAVQEAIHEVTGRTLSDYPPGDSLPIGADVQIMPTYVDYDACIYAQMLHPDDSWQGRFGHLLKENTVEVYLQDRVMKELQLYRAKIIRDGNCLFRCIAQSEFGDQERHMDVRLSTLTYINDHWHLFKDWFGIEDKSAYIREMSHDGVYAGEQEIRAMCYRYDIQIRVFLGGLNYPIRCKTFGSANHPLVQVTYICDGQYDSGHYDLVVSSQAQVIEIEETYFKWRENKIMQFKLEEANFDCSMYEDSLVGQIMLHLQRKYRDSQPEGPNNWQAGQLCVCIYSDDGRYYRAKVESVSDEGVKVNYVDFGNSETVDPSRLRREPCLVPLPRQCVKLALDGVQPLSGSVWPVPVLSYMHNLLIENGNESTIHVKGQYDEYIVVDLRTHDGMNLAEHLVDNGMARRDPSKTAVAVVNVPGTPPVLAVPSTEPVLYQCVTKPSNFAEIPNNSSHAPSIQPSPKRYSNNRPDLNPNRTINDEATESKYMQPSSRDASGSPARNAPAPATQAFATRLDSPARNTPSPARSVDSVRSSHSVSQAIVQVKKESPIKQVDPPSVTRTADAEMELSVNKSWGELMEEEDALPPGREPIRMVPSPYTELTIPDVGQKMALSITYASSPNKIYIQYIKQDDADDTVAEKINQDLIILEEILNTLEMEKDHYPPLEDIRPGAACCAMCTMDHCWYRAEVLEICGPYIGVVFIDYGNSEFLTREFVKAIPPDLISLPAQCSEARFHSVKQQESGYAAGLYEQVLSIVGVACVGIIRSPKPDISLDIILLEDFTKGHRVSIACEIFPEEFLINERNDSQPKKEITGESNESDSGESAVIEEEEEICNETLENGSQGSNYENEAVNQRLTNQNTIKGAEANSPNLEESLNGSGDSGINTSPYSLSAPLEKDTK